MEEVGVLDTVGSLTAGGREMSPMEDIWQRACGKIRNNSGADALMGDTRAHAEHDG